MTSLRWMFIHESTLTKCPLYVSPDLSSTSCKTIRTGGVVGSQVASLRTTLLLLLLKRVQILPLDELVLF